MLIILLVGILLSWPICLARAILIRNGKILCQQNCCLLAADPAKLGNEVDYIPGSPAAKAVIPAIQLHAGRTVIVEWAAAHSVSLHPDAVSLRSLPGGHRLLDGFKNIQ